MDDTQEMCVLYEESPRHSSGSLWYLRDFNFYSYQFPESVPRFSSVSVFNDDNTPV